ncbi:barstar family protein [Winogradskyella pulchriflava]|uniref:Barstar family protein n=1 Tax=Winogradskyella pulchriflava TaxID=1110688 RepID=A0ABV6QBI4_9FLAO
MIIFNINGKKIKDWKSFHSVFKKELNFPDYYGENMDAWIDCVDDLTDNTKEPIAIHINNGQLIKDNNPDILEAILECSAFVNYRKISNGDQPNLLVSLVF